MNTLKVYNENGIYLKHETTDSPEKTTNETMKMHIHNSFEIYYFVSGKIDYHIEGTTYPLRENNLLLMRPSESHAPKILERTKYERFVINFYPSLLDKIDPEHRLLAPFFDRPLGISNLYTKSELGEVPVKKLFYDMIYGGGDSYDKQLRILTSIIQILTAVSTAFHNRKDITVTQSSRAADILAYINSHILDPISIPDLADYFHLSQSQFNRNFKGYTGASPWVYITAKRLILAQELLQSGMYASSVAEKCGFKDYSTFYRAYTKQFGTSPTNKASDINKR